jgi:methionyl-tRNA formyltransferase
MARLSLVFFGTGPVAAKSLEKLSEKFDIELVITKPRKKHHKYPAPIEELAKTKDYKISFAGSTQEIMKNLKTLKPASEVGVVIDFGLIISLDVINYFKYGIINSHFSLLPKWRGADPITYTILNGDELSGVSLMKIVERLDEGPLIIQESLQVDKKDNQITLTEKLID